MPAQLPNRQFVDNHAVFGVLHRSYICLTFFRRCLTRVLHGFLAGSGWICIFFAHHLRGKWPWKKERTSYEKRSCTFRITHETDTCLQQLMAIEEERTKQYGLSPVTRSKLINEAIKNYYSFRLNEHVRDPVTEIAIKAMDRVTKENNQILLNSINAVNYNTLVAVEYLRLLCKALNFDNTKDELDVLLNVEMPWDTAIPEKVNLRLFRKQKGYD